MDLWSVPKLGCNLEASVDQASVFTRGKRDFFADGEPHSRATVVPIRPSSAIELLNRLAASLGREGRVSVHGKDWLNEDGLITAHAVSNVYGESVFSVAERASRRCGLAEPPRMAPRLAITLQAASAVADLPGDFADIGCGSGFVSTAIHEFVEFPRREGQMFWLLDKFRDTAVGPVSGVEMDYPSPSGMYARPSTAENLLRELLGSRVVQGWVPDSLTRLGDCSLAFVHISLDASQPTLDTIEWVWPKMLPGGVVVLETFNYRGYEIQFEHLKAGLQRMRLPVKALPTGQGLMWKA